MPDKTLTPDPMEVMVLKALHASGEPFEHGPAVEAHLDFHLPNRGVHIEVKQFHSDRIAGQMARVENVIVAQGAKAVGYLASLLSRSSVAPTAGAVELKTTSEERHAFVQNCNFRFEVELCKDINLLLAEESRLRAALAVSEAKLAEAVKNKDGAYEERNKLVAALARLYPSGVKATDIPGWLPEWHGCVYIDLPSGQVSWHFHDSQAHLFAGLPPYAGEWDGHDTAEKYRRVASLRSAENAGEALAAFAELIVEEEDGTLSFVTTSADGALTRPSQATLRAARNAARPAEVGVVELTRIIATSFAVPSPDVWREGAAAARNVLAHISTHSVAPVKGGWQPIGTAPKDGVTEVDLWADNQRWPDCHYHKGDWLFWASLGVDDEPHHERVPNPTHWKRDPAPPTEPAPAGAPDSGAL